MKKILTLSMLIMFAGSAFASNALLNFENKVNSSLNAAAKKEQELNNKIDAAQKARAEQRAAAEKQQAAQKAALEKKQAEQKAALEKAKKDAEAQHKATQQAINNEKNFWQNLFKF